MIEALNKALGEMGPDLSEEVFIQACVDLSLQSKSFLVDDVSYAFVDSPDDPSLALALRRATDRLRASGLSTKTRYAPDVRLDGGVTDVGLLRKLLARLGREERLAVHFNADGCHARARIVAEALEQAGVGAAKLFVMDARSTPHRAFRTLGEAGHPEGWRIHVAMLTVVEGTDGPRAMVVDPLMDTHEPIPYESWLSLIANGPVRVDVSKADTLVEPGRRMPEDYTHPSLEAERALLSDYDIIGAFFDRIEPPRA